jgi:excisionase family DNA binding protein
VRGKSGLIGGGIRELEGFVDRVPPENMDALVKAVARTSAGRAALVKAVTAAISQVGMLGGSSLALTAAVVDALQRVEQEISRLEPQAFFALAEDEDATDEAASGPVSDIDTAKLMQLAGRMLSSTEVAARLGQTRQNVNDMVKGNRILGVRFGTRWRFPEIQLCHHEVLPGLGMVLASMGEIDQWRKLQVLLSPSEPRERRPIEMLLTGEKARALAVASRAAAEIRVALGKPIHRTSVSQAMDEDLEADTRRDAEYDNAPFAVAT